MVGQAPPVEGDGLMEGARERAHRVAARDRVQQHGGRAGMDGMTVEERPGYLKALWLAIRSTRLAGTYQPHPLRRIEMPPPGGGVRQLGMPTVRDQCIQQAL
jgi:RNA-directed DNA polymerase